MLSRANKQPTLLARPALPGLYILAAVLATAQAQIGTPPFAECSVPALKWSSSATAGGLEIDGRVLRLPETGNNWMASTVTGAGQGAGYNSGVHYWTITILKPGNAYCGIRKTHSANSYSGGFTWKAPSASTDDAGWAAAPGNRGLDARGEVIGFELDSVNGKLSVYDHRASVLMGAFTATSLLAGEDIWFPFCALRYEGAIALRGPYPNAAYSPPAAFSARWDTASAGFGITVSADGRSFGHNGTSSWEAAISSMSLCRDEWFWAIRIVDPGSTYCGVRVDVPTGSAYSGSGSFVYKIPHGSSDSPGFTPTQYTRPGLDVAGNVIGFLLDADFGTLKVIDMATFQLLGEFSHSELASRPTFHPFCAMRYAGEAELIGPYPSAQCNELPAITGIDPDAFACAQSATRGFDCSASCVRNHGYTDVEFPGFSSASATATCGPVGWILDPDNVANSDVGTAKCKLHHAANDPLGLVLAEEEQEVVFGDDADVSLFRRGPNLLTNSNLFVKGVNLLEVIADLQEQVRALQDAQVIVAF